MRRPLWSTWVEAEQSPLRESSAGLPLETQRPDGTWFVREWAREYNPCFDAGFPHGNSQFVSLPATCYAAMALALALAAEPPTYAE